MQHHVSNSHSHVASEFTTSVPLGTSSKGDSHRIMCGRLCGYSSHHLHSDRDKDKDGEEDEDEDNDDAADPTCRATKSAATAAAAAKPASFFSRRLAKRDCILNLKLLSYSVILLQIPKPKPKPTKGTKAT